MFEFEKNVKLTTNETFSLYFFKTTIIYIPYSDILMWPLKIVYVQLENKQSVWLSEDIQIHSLVFKNSVFTKQFISKVIYNERNKQRKCEYELKLIYGGIRENNKLDKIYFVF